MATKQAPKKRYRSPANGSHKMLKYGIFVREYFVDYNATLAYMRAGFTASRKTAHIGACRLMARPDVQEMVRVYGEQLKAKLDATVDMVHQEVVKVAFADTRLKGSDKVKALELLMKRMKMLSATPETPTKAIDVAALADLTDEQMARLEQNLTRLDARFAEGDSDDA